MLIVIEKPQGWLSFYTERNREEALAFATKLVNSRKDATALVGTEREFIHSGKQYLLPTGS